MKAQIHGTSFAHASELGCTTTQHDKQSTVRHPLQSAVGAEGLHSVHAAVSRSQVTVCL